VGKTIYKLRKAKHGQWRRGNKTAKSVCIRAAPKERAKSQNANASPLNSRRAVAKRPALSLLALGWDCELARTKGINQFNLGLEKSCIKDFYLPLNFGCPYYQELNRAYPKIHKVAQP
jgi:hypothetical protein